MRVCQEREERLEVARESVRERRATNMSFQEDNVDSRRVSAPRRMGRYRESITRTRMGQKRNCQFSFEPRTAAALPVYYV